MPSWGPDLVNKLISISIDVGSTYAIDQKINHLHNDRVANMWRNNVPSVCGRGQHRKEKKVS